MDDGKISQVVAFCDTTPERAAQYLELADGDANQAVTLFFEHNGADLAAGHAASSISASQAAIAGNEQNPIDVDEDDNQPIKNSTDSARKSTVGGFSTSTPKSDRYEDDEAMARRLQEEMYGGQDDTVRAPISRQTETLLGPGADAIPYTGAGVDPAVEARLQAFQTRRGSGFRRGIFNQQLPTSHIWTGGEASSAALSEATGGASEASTKNERLARLFQPPWDLIWRDDWDAAREEGKNQEKWLLVNIQDASIFACQALNRDLWKESAVVETVREHFLFLQLSKGDPRAESYIRYYFNDYDNSDAYPHIAIVDPRTGEQIKVWSRSIPEWADFLNQVHEFLDRYSLKAGSKNPVAKRKAEVKKTFDQMTEEEQLEQALQASLANQDDNATLSVHDPDDLTKSISDLKNSTPNPDKGDAMSIYEKDAAILDPSPFSLIPSDQPHVEPPPGANVTRVQIRHPAGRVVRRFTVTEPVQRVYEYLKSEPLEGRAGQEFELVAMGKNLIESRLQSIEEAGLKNGTIMVEFTED